MPVKLKDGRKLFVKQPKKKVFEKFSEIQKLEESEENVDEALQIFSGFCAEILSNNTKGERVSTKYMGENYDFEELRVFIEKYMEFVSGEKNNPN